MYKLSLITGNNLDERFFYVKWSCIGDNLVPYPLWRGRLKAGGGVIKFRKIK
jgi:hypothetical protein